MKTLRNPWFIAFCLIWLTIFLCHKNSIHLPYPADEYLNDLLAVPVVAQLSLCFQRMMMRNPYYLLKRGHVIFIVIYLIVAFELILPHFFGRYTADPFDVLCYCAGGLFYWFKMNR